MRPLNEGLVEKIIHLSLWNEAYDVFSDKNAVSIKYRFENENVRHIFQIQTKSTALQINIYATAATLQSQTHSLKYFITPNIYIHKQIFSIQLFSEIFKLWFLCYLNNILLHSIMWNVLLLLQLYFSHIWSQTCK